MLQPRKYKFDKIHLRRLKRITNKHISLKYGNIGLKALESGYLTSNQINSALVTLRHYLKDIGFVWNFAFPNKAVSTKSVETGMGKGKGYLDNWIFEAKAGVILFEIQCKDKYMAINALKKCSSKLPINTKLIVEESINIEKI